MCPFCSEERYENSSSIFQLRPPYVDFSETPVCQNFLSNTGKNIVSSIHESKGWKIWYSSEGVFNGDHRGLAFAFCTDGLNPYAHEKTTYSMWPIFPHPLNLPHHMRMKVGSMLLTGIIPGPKEPNDLDPYMDIVVDDIMDLSKLCLMLSRMSTSNHEQVFFMCWITQDKTKCFMIKVQCFLMLVVGGPLYMYS